MRAVALTLSLVALTAASSWAQVGQPGTPPPPRSPEDMVQPGMAPGGMGPGAGQMGGPGAPQRPRPPQGAGAQPMGPGGMMPGQVGMPGRGMGQGMAMGPAVTPELEERIFAFLKDFAPDRLEELQGLKRANRPEYARQLGDASRLMRDVEEVKKNDPEQYELMKTEGGLRRQVMDLARDCRNSEAKEDQQKLRGELQDVLGKLFDVKVQMRQREVDRLRRELERHEKAIKDARDRKDELVKERLRDLLGESEQVFDW